MIGKQIGMQCFDKIGQKQIRTCDGAFPIVVSSRLCCSVINTVHLFVAKGGKKSIPFVHFSQLIQCFSRCPNPNFRIPEFYQGSFVVDRNTSSSSVRFLKIIGSGFLIEVCHKAIPPRHVPSSSKIITRQDCYLIGGLV